MQHPIPIPTTLFVTTVPTASIQKNGTVYLTPHSRPRPQRQRGSDYRHFHFHPHPPHVRLRHPVHANILYSPRTPCIVNSAQSACFNTSDAFSGTQTQSVKTSCTPLKSKPSPLHHIHDVKQTNKIESRKSPTQPQLPVKNLTRTTQASKHFRSSEAQLADFPVCQ